MKNIKELWAKDKLKFAVTLCWLLTIISYFWGSTFLSVTLPAIGEIFVFRVFVPITVILYIIWVIRHKEPWLKGVPVLEKWCYIFCAVLLVYGALSLLRAIEVSWTFRRLFNLTFDIAVFLLALRLFRDKLIRKLSLIALGSVLVIYAALGAYEALNGGLVNLWYNSLREYMWYQCPVVFSGNTNDYTSSIFFLITLLLVPLLQKRPNIVTGLAILVMGLLAHFLIYTSTARLVMLGFYVLIAAITLNCFIRKKMVIYLPILLIVGVICSTILFNNIRSPLAGDLALTVPSLDEMVLDVPSFMDQGEGDLQDQFFAEDEQTGETVLREDMGAGIRARLLLHAADCLKQSYGLGVGLGNSEMLARDKQVISTGIWNLHCFIARLLADYGIFILIPLAAIAWLLLKKIWQSALLAIRKKDRDLFAYSLLCFGSLLIFPIVSTSSSDAQDIIPMWIYLAGMVLFIKELPSCKEENTLEKC